MWTTGNGKEHFVFVYFFPKRKKKKEYKPEKLLVVISHRSFTIRAV